MKNAFFKTIFFTLFSSISLVLSNFFPHPNMRLKKNASGYLMLINFLPGLLSRVFNRLFEIFFLLLLIIITHWPSG